MQSTSFHPTPVRARSTIATIFQSINNRSTIATIDQPINNQSTIATTFQSPDALAVESHASFTSPIRAHRGPPLEYRNMLHAVWRRDMLLHNAFTRVLFFTDQSSQLVKTTSGVQRWLGHAQSPHNPLSKFWRRLCHIESRCKRHLSSY